MTLFVDQLTVILGDRTVLDRVSLSVETGDIVCVTGPSGSGKSTLLRAIAGLVVANAGNISWDGVSLDDMATHRRGVGLMFQDYALFPHRGVGANIAFGLRMARRSKVETAHRVEELLALVGLSGMQRRAVASLSGGEQQRVALARALAPAPRLLLLDEPLGALDRELHDRLANELRRILRQVGITALVVTHDENEANLIGDRTVALPLLSAA